MEKWKEIAENVLNVALWLFVALLVLFWLVMGRFIYTVNRDKVIFRFDEQAMSWLDAMPNTCGTCALDELPEGAGPFLFQLAALEYHDLAPEGGAARREWSVVNPGKSVTAQFLKDHFCDGCIRAIARACGSEERVGCLVVPQDAHESQFFMSVREDAWLFRGGVYVHVDKVGARAYRVNTLAL